VPALQRNFLHFKLRNFCLKCYSTFYLIISQIFIVKDEKKGKKATKKGKKRKKISGTYILIPFYLSNRRYPGVEKTGIVKEVKKLQALQKTKKAGINAPQEIQLSLPGRDFPV